MGNLCSKRFKSSRQSGRPINTDIFERSEGNVPAFKQSACVEGSMERNDREETKSDLGTGNFHSLKDVESAVAAGTSSNNHRVKRRIDAESQGK